MMTNSIIVLGGGISGIGAAVLAKKHGYSVFLSEIGKISSNNIKILNENNIEYEEFKHSYDIILEANEIIKSPGISDNSKIIQELKNKKIPIISEIEFAFRYTDAKIIAITGTNGKTTTSFLLAHILKNAGYDVLLAGNMGISFALSLSTRDYDIVVLELSSFQLDYITKFRPNVAILLNINPDHLARYDNDFGKYISSKFNITKNQKFEDFLIFNYDDINIKDIKTNAKKLPFSLNNTLEEGAYFHKKIIINLNNKNMTIQELALQGRHNIYNSMAAAMAARVFEVKDSVIRQSLVDFENIEHRLEYILQVHGIDFIDDSKATNINACWYALESMNKDVVWIAGGVDKGNDYALLSEMVKKKVKAIICLGQKNEKIINAFKPVVETIVKASNMQEAVNLSYDLANKGDVVLLSPACASFDLFENYEDRGIQFKQSVRKL